MGFEDTKGKFRRTHCNKCGSNLIAIREVVKCSQSGCNGKAAKPRKLPPKIKPKRYWKRKTKKLLWDREKGGYYSGDF